MKKYKYELAISIIGAILSIIELFLNIEFGFFIIAITILMDITLLGMRSLVCEGLKECNEIYKDICDIENDYWREKAVEKWNELKIDLKEMKEGKRAVRPNMITSEELRLINGSHKSIYCTYLSDNITKLKIRLNTNGRYNPMYSINNSYNNLKLKKLDKKRIFILDKINLEDQEVRETIKEVYEYYSELGFETKFILFSKMKEINIPYVGNMIISDNVECTICIDKTEYPDNYMNRELHITRELICSDVINPQVIQEYRNVFGRLWEMSVNVTTILG